MRVRRYLTVGVLLLATCAGLLSGSAAAITNDQKTVLTEGIDYFNTEADVICSTSLSFIALTGSDNPQKAFNFFIQKGMPAIAAAGMVGNLMEESGVDPLKLQGGSEANTPPFSTSVGWGIAQWTDSAPESPNSVQHNLVNTAKAHGQSVTDLGFQLDFLWTQLDSNPDYYDLPQLKAATTPQQAADIFQSGFERADPAQANLPVRERDALQVYQQYGPTAGVVNPGSTTSASTPCTPSSFIGSFPFYSQCDPKWSNNSYAGDNICGAGCGPTSMAMIITALTGQAITPDVVATYYTQNGFAGSFGTSWGAAPAAAQHWNLKATPLGSDATKITQALQSGSLVILAGKGGLPFTDAGHFVVVRAVASDGKWLLADPDTATGHSNTAEWDPAIVMAGVNQNGGASSVYAISK